MWYIVYFYYIFLIAFAYQTFLKIIIYHHFTSNNKPNIIFTTSVSSASQLLNDKKNANNTGENHKNEIKHDNPYPCHQRYLNIYYLYDEIYSFVFQFILPIYSHPCCAYGCYWFTADCFLRIGE